MTHDWISGERGHASTAFRTGLGALVRIVSVTPSSRLAAARNLSIDVAGLTHTGNVRLNNEDHFLVVRGGRYMETVSTNLPPGALPEDPVGPGIGITVADGMGSHAGGEVASMLATTTLIELVLAVPDWILQIDETTMARAEHLAVERVQRTHEAIMARAAEDPRLSGMGTTMTIAVSLGLDLRVIHVGDSRAYVLRGGRMASLTHDHSYAQQLLDQGQEEKVARRFRHLLTQSLGGRDPQPQVNYWRLADGDRLLVCTDGLTDMVDEATIASELGRHPKASSACRGLVRRALDAGGADNVTAAVAIYSARRR
jgi:protein phosphatase